MTWWNIEFVYPLWFLLLPAPALIAWLAPAYQTQQSVIKIPFFQLIIDALGETPQKGASLLTPKWWQRGTLLVSWVLIVTALTQPTVLGEPETRQLEGRDIMIVLDLSGSMGERDFQQPNGEKIHRLDAAKMVLNEFVALREGDRLGLILFGDAAFVQTPFTADHAAWLNLLQQTDVAMAGPSTHLGDALGLAIKAFEHGTNQQEKVAIILTDGNDTGSFVEPIEAAKVAAAKEIKMHIIAMGDPTTVGEQALDMAVIHQVASLTGGEAFAALNREELLAAYEMINQLEPQLYESQTHWPKISLHSHLLGIVIIIYLSAFTVATIQRKRRRATSSQTTLSKEGNHV
ncbi:VWA domain-containing protein [Vibrio astriarenae]|uniref:VWA domain-containing protein n=1 Tax=Vibrio astriarenae TaxID=1481923 RepID=A0A7Z2T8A0_9VIBR|nr:VWA domain-containing protein [Vibrio astriarenae]QIA66115.1 VWA domain-containing protein [Vibrio astriarenae]